MKSILFPFLRYPLHSFRPLIDRLPPGVPTKLTGILQQAHYPVRLLRYWWAGQALRGESERLGRPLTVVDLGCERGWLKHFTPEGVVEHWIGIDWVVQQEVSKIAAYDEVHQANFDDHLPLSGGKADAVVSLHVFEHLPRPGITMAEISRLLKPGGIFLGGAPTMPDWIARLRERYFRHRLESGKIANGGHITVLSPTRWRALAQDAGLDVEFATGSHLVRHTGSFLENHRWWIRLNQIWGSLFPSLGSECYLQARRTAPRTEATARLAPKDSHWRGWWIGLGVAALLTVLGLTYLGVTHLQNAEERQISAWIDAHQTGQDVFILRDDRLQGLYGQRPDLKYADDLQELYALTLEQPHAHILVGLPAARQLAMLVNPGEWGIDSRLDMKKQDYLLLKKNGSGTPLNEYLLGTPNPKQASH